MGGQNKVKRAFQVGFENRCVKLIIAAYKKTITNKSISLGWDENDITAQLHEYIESSQERIDWSISSSREHHLPKNSIQKVKGFAAKYPRIDLRFVTIKSKLEYQYFFEAKNLRENDSALKQRYIKTGIDSFSSEKYSNGCLIGYLLYGNAEKTIKGINLILEQYRRKPEVLFKRYNIYHDNYYESSHINIPCLKHYIFNFTIITD